ETLVGICMQRTNQMVIGLLGILKSGGAYVPLDPQYPSERLKFMLEDTEIKVLVTQTDLAHQYARVAQPPGPPLCAGFAHNAVEAPSAVLDVSEDIKDAYAPLHLVEHTISLDTDWPLIARESTANVRSGGT